MQFTVTAHAQRPARMDGTCFYCSQPIGAEHKLDCVLVVRRVKVRMIVEYDRYCPADWDKDMIEFHLQDSSWCATNAIDEIKEFAKDSKRADEVDDYPCICEIAKFDFVGIVGEPELKE